MKRLIKLGGTLLDSAESRHRLAGELAQLAAGREHETVIVHGGGKQMTRYLTDHGVESRFVNGLRVTTPEVVDAVLKVFAGSVNHELVAAFVAAGCKAVGLSGIDACLIEAEPMDPQLGAVGKPVRTHPEVLDVLTQAGFLPVVACVAGDRMGRIYNVNADQAAVACASGFRAHTLLFLTDVEGVKDKQGKVLPKLSPADCEELIRSGVATGGMQAKLNAATDALRSGIDEVVIAPGAEPGISARLLAGATAGTRIVAGGGTYLA